MALKLKTGMKNIFGQSRKDNTGITGITQSAVLDSSLISIYNSDLTEQDLTTSYVTINGLTASLDLEQDSIVQVTYSGEFSGALIEETET
ncbi:MAG: hypothetical protein KAU95_01860, partial [Candidatus Aenigmarchaeota archaeon]|nr:hypothetical protein [Candidatus Aenigmarchaeota archaeon]